ncbi:type IV pilus modification PilV family protein [Paraglaciecola sp. 2405UD69-4]|uniref:type IV pilus modification PilV family protein n=1 Tax=Paraglaciecola sp. 2405UD69-4 TaxID=3391836 RepID=UPI0039C9CD32
MGIRNGFSLVEVLVASLVIVIGVTGYVSLQSEYVVNNSNLQLRKVATRLAVDKLADLQFFEQLNGSGLSYVHVSNNKGGEIPFGSRDVLLSPKMGHSHSFTTSWQVIDYYYIDSDFDGLADKWVQSSSIGFPQPAPQFPDLKATNVIIDWIDLAGENKNFVLSGVVIPVPMARSFHTLYESSSLRAAP